MPQGRAAEPPTYRRFDDDDLRKTIFLEGEQFHLVTGEPVNDRTGQPLAYMAQCRPVITGEAEITGECGSEREAQALFLLVGPAASVSEVIFRVTVPEASPPWLFQVTSSPLRRWNLRT